MARGKLRGSVITLGTASERPACQQVAAAAAPNGLNLAGSTTLPELAAVLALANVVLCNDLPQPWEPLW